MAYLRYSPTCDWYIFWEWTGTKPERIEDESLAAWHVDHRHYAQSLTYAQVKGMLRSGDFSAIPGFAPKYETEIRTALSEFVQGMEREYGLRDE